MLSLLLTAAMAASASAPTWQDGLDWHGVHVSMGEDAKHSYTLDWPFGQRVIPAQPLRADTASVLFDGLYAMAQDDLKLDSVTAIRDGAFDHGQPIPCHCFETGLKWPYVWTRDLSYSIDLGLWRFDPARARNGLRFKLSDVRVPSAPQGLYVMQDTGSGGSWPISTDRVVWFLGARHLLGDKVLHYQALQLAATLAGAHHDAQAAAAYRAQAAALKTAINAHFWRADRGMYMSYIGGDGTPVDTYDLLGISLAITSGVADGEHARQTLANYPSWPAGSPVMWPERADQPIYHNRAIWPFVSAYALRAARTVNDPVRIAHEIRSVMRGAALYGSNLENYELLTQGQHVDDGKLSGPVVNSPRQLWSVAAYLDIVAEGVFGLTEDGRIEPKLPTSLLPTLFGKRSSISLSLPGRHITLLLPKRLKGNLLVADHIATQGNETTVQLKAITVQDAPLRLDAPLYAPQAPAAPTLIATGNYWTVKVDGTVRLYVNGQRAQAIDGSGNLPRTGALTCVSATRVDARGLESLPSPDTCAGDVARVAGDWPRHWSAPAAGSYRVALDYRNDHGPINTGITAAVKMLAIRCNGSDVQRVPIVMPHSVGQQSSTYGTFAAHAGASCRFALDDGFNMSYLRHFAHYTGGAGGIDGPLNDASIGDLLISPLASSLSDFAGRGENSAVRGQIFDVSSAHSGSMGRRSGGNMDRTAGFAARPSKARQTATGTTPP